MVVWLCNFKQF